MKHFSSTKAIGLLGLFGAALFGGGIMPTLIRTGASAIDPFIFNWLRNAIGLLLILPFYISKYSLANLFDKKHRLLLLILGLGLSLNITFFSIGVLHTTLVASQLIYVLVPLIVSLLAFLLLGERLNTYKVLGMSLALIGVLILIIFSRSSEERQSLGSFYGNFIILIGMLGYSSYVAFSRKFTQKLSVIQLVTLTNLALSISLSPLALFSVVRGGVSNWTPLSIGVTVLVGLSGLIFISLVQVAIKHLSAATASLTALLSPEFAVIAGILLYHERISILLILSLALSVFGVFISSTGESKHWWNHLLNIPTKITRRLLR